MAKAWIRDRWLKSKAVVDGVELTPTTGMKRQVAANPATAGRARRAPEVPTTGRHALAGLRWRRRRPAAFRREACPHREAAEARGRRNSNDDIRSGRYVDPRGGNRTLDEVFPLWLADHTGVRPATIDNYIRHYNGMVRPRFGSTRIGDIDERAVKAWVADLDSGAIRTKYGEPYTKGAIKTGVRRLLGSMLRYAVRRRWIMADPTAGVRLPRAPMQRVDAFTPAEARAIADAAGKLRTPTGRPCGRPMDRLIVLLLASTGMRPGEMAALDVRDVDPRARHDQRRQDHDQGRGRPLPVRAERHQDPQGPPAPADTAVPARRAGGAGRRPRRRRTPVHLPARRTPPLRPVVQARVPPRHGRRRNRPRRARPDPLLPAPHVRVRRHRGRRRRQDIAGAHGHEDATVTLNTYAAAFADRRVEVAAPCPTRSTTRSARHPRTGISEQFSSGRVAVHSVVFHVTPMLPGTSSLTLDGAPKRLDSAVSEGSRFSRKVTPC